MTSADPLKTPAHAILLVDDNAHGMVARRRVLLDLGYQVKTACSAQEALAIIAEGVRIDVLVTDYKMPCMTGIELITELKTISPHTRTILLSALIEPWGMTEDSTGADAVMQKSSTEANQLTRTVQGLLQKRVEKKPAASQRARLRAVVKNA
jgi:CheY-like chemotaxis protein